MTTPSPLSPVVGEAQASPVEKFRRKPLEVEAIQYTGENPDAVAAFAGEGYTFGSFTGAMVLHAPAAEVYVYEGEWVTHREDGSLKVYNEGAFAALFDPAPEPLELTPAEQAAAARSEHMSTCHEEACVECMRELRVIRRIVKAIRPVIATELAAKHERELLEARQRAAIHADTLLRITEMLDTINDYTLRSALRSAIAHGRNAIAAIPVAAALDPTPIPDGGE